MEHGDVVFEFRIAEFGMLLLVLSLIYGITWLKKVVEGDRAAGPAMRPASAGDGRGGAEDPPSGADEPPVAGDSAPDDDEPA